jgi:hypothetical protein
MLSLERVRYSGMHFLTLRAKQSAVSCILHERMLEGVDCLISDPARPKLSKASHFST